VSKIDFKIGFVAFLAILPSTFAAAAGNVENGAQIASRWCSTCHVVNEQQQQASADVPPFSAIAKAPGFSEEKVAAFLLDPHPKMPNLSLSRSETDDLAAYIGSLAN
jgi:mono/diheme cytochrome c family protein